MKDFIIQVLSSREKFIPINIGFKDIAKIEATVMKELGLENLKDLRDKFEGIKFHEVFKLKTFGVIALELLLKEDLINWEEIQPRDYEPFIIINGVEINVLTFDYGEFPMIDKLNTRPAIFACKRTRKDVWVCGYADIKTLNENQNDKFIKSVMTRNIESKTTFVGFNKLLQFESIEELKKML